MNDCTDIRRRIRQGERDRVASHLETCSSCAEFADAFSLLGELDADEMSESLNLDDAFISLKKEIESQSPFRRFLVEQPTWIRFSIVGLCALLAAVLIWMFVRRVDWSQYPIVRWLPEASAMLLVTVSAIAATLRPMYHPPWSKTHTFGLLALAATALLAPLLLPEAHTAHPESLKGVGEDFLRRAAACFGWGIAVGGAVGIPAYIAVRGPRGVKTLPLAFWGAMGFFAQLALHLHCPIIHPMHIALGHTAIVPTLLLVYALGRLRHSSIPD